MTHYPLLHAIGFIRPMYMLWKGAVVLLLMVSACLPEAPPPTVISPTNTGLPVISRAMQASPTATISPTATSPPTATSETAFNGRLAAFTNNLDLRASPGTAGQVIRVIQGVAPLTIRARSEDTQWLQVVFADGVSGWLLASAVETDIDLAALPITGSAENLPGVPIEPTPLPDAIVQERAGGLRLRSFPGVTGDVLDNLTEFEPLTVISRTFDELWLEVLTPEGVTGWVATGYLDLNIPLSDIPASRQTVIASPIPPTPEPLQSVITNVNRSNLRPIFERGQERGNRADVFSKVGDSLTVSTYFFFPIGWGEYNLAEYDELQEVITYFSATTARDDNSFANASLAAFDGWTTQDVLDPARAHPDLCEEGESPIACEYRITQPAISLILFGSNDVGYFQPITYRENLERIVQITMDSGVIPVVSTIPEREGYNVGPFNQVVLEIAQAYGVPLWDYARVMQDAPNGGISEDGVHPSVASIENPALSTDFNIEYLDYGYNLRNLTGLLVLDTIWRRVLADS